MPRPTTTKPKGKEDIFSLMSQVSLEGANAARKGGGSRFWPGLKPNPIDGEGGDITLTCQITGFKFDPQGITFQQNGVETSDPTCHFEYLIIDESDPELTGKTVQGERWWIPLNSGPAPSEAAERARAKANDRWAAFVEDLLGRPAASWGQDVKEMIDLFESLEAEDIITAQIRFEWFCREKERTKKSKTGEGDQTTLSKNIYYGDYLSELLEMPQAASDE